MKKHAVFLSSLFLAATQAFGDIIIYNQSNPPTDTDVPSGGQGNYRGFSVRLSDAALTTDYTAPDSAPLASNLGLKELILRRAGGAVGGTANVYLSVYTAQTPTVGTFVGNSTNTNNMRNTDGLGNVTYSFDTLALSSSTTYWFYFTTVLGAQDSTGTFNAGRLRVSNFAGHTYTSGNLISGTTFANQDTAYDALFVAKLVPEPASAALGALGFGLLALVRRRR